MKLFKLLVLPLLLISTIQVGNACPPDEEQMVNVTKLISEKFNHGVCRNGIKPGNAEDINFLKEKILPYYLSKEWLTKELPQGIMAEIDNVEKKCHKNTYNYCLDADWKKAGDCIKGMAGSLMLKYGSTVMAYCPILDEKFKNFETNDWPQVQKFFTMYCTMKGKTC